MVEVSEKSQEPTEQQNNLVRSESKAPWDLPEFLHFIPADNRREAIWIVSLAAPLAASLLAQYANNLITIWFQGQLGGNFLSVCWVQFFHSDLSRDVKFHYFTVLYNLRILCYTVVFLIYEHYGNACANCVFFLNLFVSNIIIGINSGIDALATQAYGAKLYKNVGLVCQRAMFLQACAFIPMAFMLFFSGSILNGLGFDATVTPLSQAYLRICIWGVPPLMIIDTIRRWLEAQGIAYISMGCSFFGFVLCWPLNHLMVRSLGYGAVGSAYTFNLINWLTVALLVIYCFFSKVYIKTLAADKFSFAELFAPKQMFNYIKFAAPATGTMLSEFLSFEIQAIIANRISKHAVAGQLLIFAINGFLYHIPLSYGIAAATRVGHLMGSNRGSQAKSAFIVLLQLTTLSEIVIAIILLCLSNTMPRWFTSDENVLEIVTGVVPLLAIFSIFNGNQVVMSGILRATKSSTVRFQFIVNILCYWALAIPLGYYLALHASEHTFINNDGEKVTAPGIGVMGQWMALGLASFIIQVIYFFYLFYLDWDAFSTKISASTHKNANQNIGDHGIIGSENGSEMQETSTDVGGYAQYHDEEQEQDTSMGNDPFNYPVEK